MVFMSIQDFFEKAASCRRLTRDEELRLAEEMKNGSSDARERLIESYIPMVAGHIRHAKPHLQTLGMALYCIDALEKAVDSFDFTQESEPFSHRLSWWLRQASTSYIVR